MNNNTQKWALYMDGELHTTNLSKQQADAMFATFAARDPHGDEVDMHIAPVEQYPRLCDKRKTGMFTGYVFFDGQFECEDEADALEYAQTECGYADLDEAYNDEAYYYTEWEECDDTWYECHNERWYEVTANSVEPIKNA